MHNTAQWFSQRRVLEGDVWVYELQPAGPYQLVVGKAPRAPKPSMFPESLSMQALVGAAVPAVVAVATCRAEDGYVVTDPEIGPRVGADGFHNPHCLMAADVGESLPGLQSAVDPLLRSANRAGFNLDQDLAGTWLRLGDLCDFDVAR
jgi:hypothetical protein